MVVTEVAPKRIPLTLPDNSVAPPPVAPPLQAVRFGSKEVITLEVRGGLFANWTTVHVEQKVTEAFPTFQFDATEESPVPLTVAGEQFIPGDIVRVYVGGISAVFGYITERQVGFEGNNHLIRLVGVGDTFDLTNSMVPPERLNGHDGKNWLQLAKDLSAHLGISIDTLGNVDMASFKNIQVQPGETIMATLERYARMRNIVIGSNPNGGLLAIGENPAIGSGYLTEGDNIERANCVLRDEMAYRKYYMMGQATGGDDAYGDSQNQQIATLPGSSSRNRMSVGVADISDTMHGIQRRVKMEQLFCEGSILEAQIVVQGWFKDNNESEQVWKAGEYYIVNSPSLILNNVLLGCAGCAYDQTDAGSFTTLTMVNPLHMNGQLNYRADVNNFLGNSSNEPQ